MKAIVQDLNDNLNIKSLCRNFPMRVQELIDVERYRTKRGCVGGGRPLVEEGAVKF